MPRVNRTEMCASEEVQAFHLINRCVRRTYLCGKDRRSGKDYSHRKEWIRERLEELAGIFGIDVLHNVPSTLLTEMQAAVRLLDWWALVDQ